jgi:hypothetical protein
MKHPPQEPEVLSGRALAGVGTGIVLILVVAVMIALALGRCRSRELGHAWVPARVPQITGDINAIETRLFSIDAQGLEEHRREDTRLRGYGWIDRAHRIVHVPIDVAIELYLSQQGSGQGSGQ